MKRRSKLPFTLIALLGIIIFVIIFIFRIQSVRNDLYEQRFTTPFAATHVESAEDPYPTMLSNLQSEQQLTAFRCTEPFVNDGADRFFWKIRNEPLYEEVQHETFRHIIQDTENSLPDNKILLSGRFCELEDGSILYEYYASDPWEDGIGTGKYNGKNVSANSTILANERPRFTPGVEFLTQPFWPYASCSPPKLITQDKTVYLFCGVIQSSMQTKSYLIKVNPKHNTSAVLEECVITYSGGMKRKCSNF